MKKCKGLIIIIIFCVLLSYELVIKCSTVLAVEMTAIRVYGNDRYATSIAISQRGWVNANTVIIASGLDFPDALSASALSKSKDAPILLTNRGALSVGTIAEIKRLKAKEAIIVGGNSVISDNIENQLIKLGINITRVGGTDRYDTSKQVAKLLPTTNGIIIAAGANFPDALSIAAIAGIKSMPILLSPKESLNSNVTRFIQNKNIPVSYIVGGTGALSSTIDSMVPMSRRLSGNDRYETNLAVIEEFTNNLKFDTVYLVLGDNFPDALCGAALAAKNNAPIFLIDKNSIPAKTKSFLKDHNVKQIIILGGTGVISKNVENTLNSRNLDTDVIIVEQQTPLYNSLKEKIIPNIENRVRRFTIVANGNLKESMDTYKEIMKDIEFTNPYEYYNMMSWELSAIESEKETLSTLTVTIKYRTTKEQEDYVTAQVNDIIPKIIKNSMTTSEKELAIHDWIVNNVQYDKTMTKYTAYSALAEHSTVCQGYALLTYKMLLKAEIQTQIVSGTANNGEYTESHAWNLVNVDGNWYHLDSTWDDPVSSKPILEHTYFNLTDEQIAKNHFWNKANYKKVSKILFY